MDKDKFMGSMNEEAKRFLDTWMKKTMREHFKHEFANFNCSDLPKMTKKELAEWQSKHPMDSPQYIIALQEWNRRLTAEQVKATRFAAYIGIISAVLGAIVGASIALFPQFLSSQKVYNNISIERKIKDNNQDYSKQKTKERETYIKAPVGQRP